MTTSVVKWLTIRTLARLGVFWGLSCLIANAQVQYPEEILRFADMVLYNGNVLTADRDDANFSIREAVAIRDGKILAVGHRYTQHG